MKDVYFYCNSKNLKKEKFKISQIEFEYNHEKSICYAITNKEF